MLINFAALKGSLPGDMQIVLADVGSAGGIHKRWHPVRPIVSALLFEPREGGQMQQQGNDTIFPIALGAQAGRATLNVTALPNMSSTLLPNRALLETFRKKGAHTRITSTFDMPVDTLDAVSARSGRPVNAIKVDTQGSEMSILQGATQCLASSVIVAEVEVSFFQRYEGQALAWDIVAFMKHQGFELLDLSRLKRYRRLNAAGVGNRSMGGGQRAGRLAYGDALFFLEESRLLARIEALSPAEAEALALKSIVALLVYGKPDMAAHLFDGTAHVIDSHRCERLKAYFASLARGPFRAGVLHHVFDYLARHV